MATLRINGEERHHTAEPDMPLLWLLRDELGLTGTKFGCGIAYCGACTVEVDGVATRSCVLPCGSVEGKSIRTIDGAPDAIVKALEECRYNKTKAAAKLGITFRALRYKLKKLGIE